MSSSAQPYAGASNAEYAVAARAADAVRVWTLAALAAGAVVLILILPYLLGYWFAPPGTHYTGLLVNVEDANYLTIIRRGSEGAWMHSLRFTSEPDAPAPLYLFYLALGHLARRVGMDAVSMWHVARAALGFATLLAVFGFVGEFTDTRREQWVAFWLAALGAGFDWFRLPGEVVHVTDATPIDLKMADAHLFSAALTYPHYLASILLLVALFWCALRLCIGGLTRPSWIALLVGGGLASAGIVLVYPFFGALAAGVLFVYWVLLALNARRVLWREGLALALLLLPALPLAAVYARALSANPALQAWAAQAVTLSPNPLHYLLAFAPYLLLGWFDLRAHGLGDAQTARRRALLWGWVLAVALLVYTPLPMQRRFIQGVQIPLAVLAALGWCQVVLPRLMQTRRAQALLRRPHYTAEGVGRLMTVGLVAVLAVSSLYQWTSALVLTTGTRPYPLFRPATEIEAMDWLRAHAAPDDVVLGTYFVGSYLPLRAGTRVYLGHYYETIDFERKQLAVERFFGESTNAARRTFLDANDIDYVLVEPRASWADEAERSAFLHREFENADAAVYRVTTR